MTKKERQQHALKAVDLFAKMHRELHALLKMQAVVNNVCADICGTYTALADEVKGIIEEELQVALLEAEIRKRTAKPGTKRMD